MKATLVEDGAATFEEAVEKLRVATGSFVNGDNTQWKAMCSHGEDVSVAGRAGGFDIGWAHSVENRYDWVADQYASGDVAYETISSYFSGDLGYSLEVARGTILLKGKNVMEPVEVRVTHIFRREEGRWKLLHRHADQTTVRRPLADLSQV